MKSLDAVAGRIAQALALIGALGVLAMLVHISADVLARNLVGRPIPATNEIVARYYMLLIAFLPLAWVERERSMVSVELLDGVMSARVRQVSDMLVALFVTGIYLALFWVNWQSAVSRWRIGSFIDVLGREIPVWPGYFLLPAGFLLAAMVTLLRVAQTIRGPVAS